MWSARHSHSALIALLAIPLLTAVNVKPEGSGQKPNTQEARAGGADLFVFPHEDHSSTEGSTPSLRAGLASPQNIVPTPCPKGERFCDTAPDYPKSRIQALLRQNPSVFNLKQFYEEADVVNKFSDMDHPDEQPLCPSKSHVVFPQKGVSDEGVLEFIVNEKDYKQGIKVESCLADDQACSLPGSLSLGYNSHCRQKYIQRTLVVVNRNTSAFEGLVTKPFQFPSCCACMVSGVANRFRGESLSPATPSNKIKG